MWGNYMSEGRVLFYVSHISELVLNHVMYFMFGLRLYCQHKARLWSAFAGFVLIRLGFHSLLEFIRIRLPPKASRVLGIYLSITAWSIWII